MVTITFRWCELLTYFNKLNFFFMSNYLRKRQVVLLCLAMLFFTGTFARVTVELRQKNTGAFGTVVFTSCEPLELYGLFNHNRGGVWKFEFNLTRNGSENLGTTTIHSYSRGNKRVDFLRALRAGRYRIRVKGFRRVRVFGIGIYWQWKFTDYSDVIDVELQLPNPVFTLNGVSQGPVIACTNGRVVLNPTGSVQCDPAYFLALQEVDSNGNRRGRELMEWFPHQLPQEFNLHAWAANNSFGLTAGHSYVVTLALNPWRARSMIFQMEDPNPQISIGGRVDGIFTVRTCDPFNVDLSGSTCLREYELGVTPVTRQGGQLAPRKFQAFAGSHSGTIDMWGFFWTNGLLLHPGNYYMIDVTLPGAGNTRIVDTHMFYYGGHCNPCSTVSNIDWAFDPRAPRPELGPVIQGMEMKVSAMPSAPQSFPIPVIDRIRYSQGSELSERLVSQSSGSGLGQGTLDSLISGYQMLNPRLQVKNDLGNVQKHQNLDVLKGRRLAIFPNPSRGQFKVSLSGPEIDHWELVIINSVGQIVQKVSCENSNDPMDLDCASLPNGSYLLRALGPGFQEYGKLVIQR